MSRKLRKQRNKWTRRRKRTPSPPQKLHNQAYPLYLPFPRLLPLPCRSVLYPPCPLPSQRMQLTLPIHLYHLQLLPLSFNQALKTDNKIAAWIKPLFPVPLRAPPCPPFVRCVWMIPQHLVPVVKVQRFSQEWPCPPLFTACLLHLLTNLPWLA